MLHYARNFNGVQLEEAVNKVFFLLPPITESRSHQKLRTFICACYVLFFKCRKIMLPNCQSPCVGAYARFCWFSSGWQVTIIEK